MRCRYCQTCVTNMVMVKMPIPDWGSGWVTWSRKYIMCGGCRGLWYNENKDSRWLCIRAPEYIVDQKPGHLIPRGLKPYI